MLYSALDVVSRELVGMIPAVMLSAKSSQLSHGLGQVERVSLVPETDNEDVVPGASIGGDGQDIDHIDVAITKVRRAKPIVWNGDEELSLGSNINPIVQNQYVQAMRSLVNEMEADVAIEAAGGALSKGNVVGTVGTEPFISDTKVLTRGLKMLKDNGAPQNADYQFVMNTTAGMNLRNLANLQKVNEAGDSSLLRQGLLGNLFGFNLRESNGLKPHTGGTASGYLVNGKAAKGETVIAIDTGSGTFVKGDIVKFGSDDTQYVVAEDVATGGTSLKIAGGLVADVADNADVTVATGYNASVGFARSSIVLATRLPSVPRNGDNALDRLVITDPISNISFEVALWGEPYQSKVTIAAAWGAKNIKAEHTFALIG